MAHKNVKAIANPLSDKGDKVILLGVTGLSPEEKATLKALRGPNGGYFTWDGSFKAYTAKHSDDLFERAEQFAIVHDNLVAAGVVVKPEAQASEDKVAKAAARAEANNSAFAKLLAMMPQGVALKA